MAATADEQKSARDYPLGKGDGRAADDSDGGRAVLEGRRLVKASEAPSGDSRRRVE